MPPSSARHAPSFSRHALALFAVAVLAASGCARAAPATPAARYTPHTRELTITTVPLLVKEQRQLYPFLAKDFAKGGVLSGKEVYAFSPSTLTVVEGDTIHFTFVNPEDDQHSFVLPGLVVPLPGQQVTHATYVARRAGVFPFLCSVPSHLPMMRGQLVVLAPSAVAGAINPPA
ncbi:MAG TPA: cupredoxin domain-containing protein [Gemmatimonadaceae bacterium]|nr:cupredoxin domain-containing protein [Gemmatimonadaceae bacterium]